MSYRVQCSACGKVMTLEDDAAGERLVCIACGTMLTAPPPPIVQAAQAPGEADAELTAAAASRPAQTPATTAAPRGVGRRTTILTAAAVSFAVVAIASLVVILLLNRRDGGRRPPGDRTFTSKEMRENSDLLALKSDAEALAIQGKLAEAHEKYRTLQQLAVGRDIKDPLLWDIMERAKLDQDNVYMLLLRQQIPPGQDPGAAYVVPPYAQNGTPGNPPLPSTGPAQPAVPGANTAIAQAVPGNGADAGAQANANGGNEAGAAAPDEAPATQQVAASQPGSPTMVMHSPPPGSITDEQVGDSMKKGIDFLLAHVQNGELVQMPGVEGVKHQGMNALVVYALLTCGQATGDERLNVRGDLLKAMLEKMKSHPMEVQKGVQQPVTYARSLRAAALAFYNRPEDKKVLKSDVDWLVAAAFAGAYTYDDQFTRTAGARRDGPTDPAGPQALAPDDAARLREFLAALAVAEDDWSGDTPPTPAGLWRGDGSGLVRLTHGIHDAQGRELYVPMTPGRIPLTPMPQGYPPRPPMTRPPGVGGPQGTLGQPGGMYGQPRPGMITQPNQTPVREENNGSMSSPFPWDHSNSQYGLLGVWAGAEVGVEVPVRYWRDVERHWTETQLSSGEWGYAPRDKSGTMAMTCGGVASLFVTHDWLAAPALKETGREPFTPALLQGLRWLERGDNCTNTPNSKTHYVGYDLFGLERVALASGFKYFGKHDWYRELASNALGMQWPTGAWGREDDGPDAVVDTAYTLLFLARGRYPILMNKLRFDRSEVTRLDGKPAPGYWANRPRDLANLTRFASRQLEKGLNWQVVAVDTPWNEWLDAPVLYVASHQAPLLQEEDYQNLRRYVEAGGILFTHADTGAVGFNKWVNKLVEKVAPGRALEDLPADHPVYGINYKIKQPRPRLQGVSNGARLVLVHAPDDLSTHWQQRNEKIGGDTFKLGVNLFLYAAGKANFRNRLSTPYVPQPKGDPQGRVLVARVKYNGNWDPEPGAWGRFARLFQWQTNFAPAILPMDLAGLKDAGEVQVAHLTGTAPQTFTDAEVASVKAFVENGGTLLVDSCGGNPGFAQGVQDDLLAKAFPGAKGEKVAGDHPLLKPAGEKEALVPKLRPFAAEQFKDAPPELTVMGAGKGYVVVSPLDLTSGLLGTSTWGIAGYEPVTAQAIVRNALLWAHARPEVGK